MTLLALDIGRGTQDILVYDPAVPAENCVKMVLPAPSVVAGREIRKARAEGRPVHLTGTTMGGGENVRAVSEHLSAGLPVSATPKQACLRKGRYETLRLVWQKIIGCQKGGNITADRKKTCMSY